MEGALDSAMMASIVLLGQKKMQGFPPCPEILALGGVCGGVSLTVALWPDATAQVWQLATQGKSLGLSLCW